MPNRRLYPVLLTISLVISFCSLLIHVHSAWFTIVSSIGCGGVASVLVAWLIEYSNWRAQQEKTLLNRETVLRDFFNKFDSGVGAFVHLSLDETLCKEPLVEMPWIDWVELSYDKISENSELIRYYVDACRVFLDGIEAQATVINGQKSILLDQKILEADDIKAISAILSYCTYVHWNQLPQIITMKEAKQFRDHCFLIHVFLKDAPVLCEANEIKTGSVVIRALDSLRSKAKETVVVHGEDREK